MKKRLKRDVREQKRRRRRRHSQRSPPLLAAERLSLCRKQPSSLIATAQNTWCRGERRETIPAGRTGNTTGTLLPFGQYDGQDRCNSPSIGRGIEPAQLMKRTKIQFHNMRNPFPLPPLFTTLLLFLVTIYNQK